MDTNANNYLVEMKHIVKKFPGVVALDDVSFNLKPGEVHILMGENGAGKSTLIKILSGAYAPEEGEVFVCGEKVTQFDPISMKKRGIETIYQEFNLVPYLNVAENIFIDHMPKKGMLLDKKGMHKQAEKILDDMNMNVDTTKYASDIPVAQQQMVEVAKALTNESKVMIMDEPTATLSDLEIKKLFEIVRALKEKGMGIIYISHRMQEIKEIGDRITIMRDGKHIDTAEVADITNEEIIRKMVGRDLGNLYQRSEHTVGQTVLKVENLNAHGTGLTDINIEIRRGEIVGLAGLVGAGRTELARAIFHVDPYDTGKIFLNGEEVPKKASPSDMIRKGVALIPEDRKRQGLSLMLSVSENTIMASLGKFSRKGWMQKKAESSTVKAYIEELNIATPSPKQKANNLSGGNQQKVVLAKWLCTEGDVIIFDEPTRGIDVGAKSEVYGFMDRLAKEGKAIIMISSEMPELLGMCDRIYVMRNRKIAKELPISEASQELILSYAMEGARAEENE